MSSIIEFIQETYQNQVFSSSDRKKLKALLNESSPSIHDLNVIRAKVFDWVREQSESSNVLQLINWLEGVNKCLLPNNIDSSSDNRTYFSPGNDCEDAIIQLLRRARKNVKICVFTISENEITKEIIAAHQRGISVKIITDNEKLDDRGSDIRRLANEGIIVKIDKGASHMHHKFCVIDKEILLTGSYNWTKSAADRNQENLLVTEDKNTVKSYIKEFEKLWDNYPVF